MKAHLGAGTGRVLMFTRETLGADRRPVALYCRVSGRNLRQVADRRDGGRCQLGPPPALTGGLPMGHSRTGPLIVL